MGIPVIFGIRKYGRYNERGGSYRATRFFHLFLLPIIPVGGVRGHHGAHEEAAPVSILSVLLGYFKVYAFLGTLVSLLSLTIIVSKSSEAGVLWPVALGIWVAMTFVVSTWFWVGGDPRSSAGRKIGGTLAVVLPAGALFGFALYSSAADQKAADHRDAVQAQLAAASEASKRDSIKKALGAMLDQHAGAPVEKLTRCSNEMFDVITAGDHVTTHVAEAGYLRAAGGAGLDEGRAMEWLMPERLRVDPSRATYTDADLDRFAEHQLLTVVSIEPPPASPRGPARLRTKVTFHELPSGRGVCGLSFSTPVPAGKTLADTAVRTAYLAALKSEITGVNARLVPFLPGPAKP